MYGVTLAFKDYSIKLGIMGSKWAGLKYFRQFLNTPNMTQYIRNTVLISFYSILFGFPAPILLALMLNEVQFQKFKKTVQMATFAPYFISTVVVVGMLIQILSIRGGLVNTLLGYLGVEPINFMGKSSMFRTIYIASGIWQGMGYSSILYIAALSSVDENLYEAVWIDGASRLQKIIHIDIPTILPTITLSLIMSVGGIMSVGADKAYLMQNGLNLSTSEVISTFVYKIGLINGQYSFSTAVSLFNTVINLALMWMVNMIARHVGETSMW